MLTNDSNFSFLLLVNFKMNVFDNTPSLSERSNADLSLNQLRDGLASITHRVGQIELLINKKVEPFICRWIDQNVWAFLKKRQAVGNLNDLWMSFKIE